MRSVLTFPIRVSVPVLASGAAASAAAVAELPPLRPPAVPLVACDPYFSVWSFADRLTDEHTRHWTGAVNAMVSLVRIDGRPFRVMGPDPAEIPALPQERLQVLPTRTVYRFEGAGVRLTLTFLTPALPDSLDILARPVTYLTWEVAATDGQTHAVSLYYDHTAEAVVNTPDQPVDWARQACGPRVALRFGSSDQPILVKKGDNLRIDWGYLYAVSRETDGLTHALAPATACRTAFAQGQSLPPDDARRPRPARDQWPAAAFRFELGPVGTEPVSRTILLAYDDLFGIQYFRQDLRSYWRRQDGTEAVALLRQSLDEYPVLGERCARFDAELLADLTTVGGARYAALCALAYRQCLAGNKLVADANGQPLLFPKENFSNGCIGTVDVIYPMEPLFLLLSPALVKASLRPVLDYAASGRWRFPFAPHDLGTYPQANGQVYGGGERTEDNQMPVEETGNLLLLLAALAQAEGTTDFAAEYWPMLERWAEYLRGKGFDPENQLCTDDFAGHLAHNVNLSAKAILAMGAYAQLCEKRGAAGPAATYRELARSSATRWVELAADGDHFRLAFDRPGTWSQKYNLVWDRILGLGLFPADVAAREMAFYRKTQNRFGLPLDCRKAYTKLDWTLWTATLTGKPEDFAALLDPIWAFLNESPSRVPLTDWYETVSGKVTGFQARPVIGGVFLRLLSEPGLWAKWARRDQTRLGQWAPLPTPPRYRNVVAAAEREAVLWRYTFDQPAIDWFGSGFDASAWSEGPAGFGTEGTPGAIVRTQWATPDIWLRREFELPQDALRAPEFWLHHDEDAEVYLNGVLALQVRRYTVGYEAFPVNAAGRAALRPGRNLVAVHCHQTVGGQYIDLGLVDRE